MSLRRKTNTFSYSVRNVLRRAGSLWQEENCAIQVTRLDLKGNVLQLEKALAMVPCAGQPNRKIH
jgi:hypothetical protein